MEFIECLLAMGWIEGRREEGRKGPAEGKACVLTIVTAVPDLVQVWTYLTKPVPI